MRDRDPQGRAQNSRPRDELGRPLPYGASGVEPLPEPIDTSPEQVVELAEQLLDDGLPFQAHEVFEAAWKDSPAPQKPAWQGLAQLAVALTHDLRGNPVGAARLRGRAEQNLQAGDLPDCAAGVRDRLLAATAGPAPGPVGVPETR